jgi:hypothetical protein
MCKNELKKKIKDLKVNDGEKIKIKCKIKGENEKKVKWKKNGKDLSYYEILEMKYKKGVEKIKINEVLNEDEGKYVCEEKN